MFGWFKKAKKEPVQIGSELSGGLGPAEFLVSIDDGFCEWSYKLKLSGDLSIHAIAEKMCDALGTGVPCGEIRREWKSKVRA